MRTPDTWLPIAADEMRGAFLTFLRAQNCKANFQKRCLCLSVIRTKQQRKKEFLQTFPRVSGRPALLPGSRCAPVWSTDLRIEQGAHSHTTSMLEKHTAQSGLCTEMLWLLMEELKHKQLQKGLTAPHTDPPCTACKLQP